MNQTTFTVFRSNGIYLVESDKDKIKQLKEQGIEYIGEMIGESTSQVMAMLVAIKGKPQRIAPDKYSQLRHCSNCGLATPHTKNTTNHILHAALTVVLFGLWLIIWLAIYFTRESGSGKCLECGCSNY